jgi:hypothetical protein
MATSPAGKKPAPRKTTAKKPAALAKPVGKAAPARKAVAKKKALPAKKVAGKPAPARIASAPMKPAPTKKPAAKRVGAPSLYTPALALAICDHIANCVPLRAIAAMEGMPTVATVMNWLADDNKPEFLEQYARAREAQADRMAEDILAIADEECTMVRTDKHGSKDDDGEGHTEVVFDATAVARNRLRVDARKWLASKMAPKKYGDKLQTELTGADGGPVAVQSTVTFVQAPAAQERESQ